MMVASYLFLCIAVLLLCILPPLPHIGRWAAFGLSLVALILAVLGYRGSHIVLSDSSVPSVQLASAGLRHADGGRVLNLAFDDRLEPRVVGNRSAARDLAGRTVPAETHGPVQTALPLLHADELHRVVGDVFELRVPVNAEDQIGHLDERAYTFDRFPCWALISASLDVFQSKLDQQRAVHSVLPVHLLLPVQRVGDSFWALVCEDAIPQIHDDFIATALGDVALEDVEVPVIRPSLPLPI